LAAQWDEVSEVVPGMNNLTLFTHRPVRDLDTLHDRILQAWPGIHASRYQGRVVEIPVVYGGDAGPDLANVARHTGLSKEEVIAAIAAVTTWSISSASCPALPTWAAWPRNWPRRATPPRA
jgi:allophanate hydrolase subunit 1